MERLVGSLFVMVIVVLKGVDIICIYDVKEIIDIVKVVSFIRKFFF